MRQLRCRQRGFTLIELLISVGFFAILSAMMYTTFNLIQKQVTVTGSENSLFDKGQRILSFIEEDIRMIGALIGPDARIPYCIGTTVSPSTPNVVAYTGSNPYDTLQFLTSRPVTITNEGTASCMTNQLASDGITPRPDYFLTTVGETVAGGTTVNVDANINSGTTTCSTDIDVNTAPTKNGRSLVTFDSLLLSAASVAGSAPQVYYSLNTLGGSTLTFDLYESLNQNIPDNSTVYAVRQYRYYVFTTGGKRNLRRMGWDKECATTATDVTVDLIETSNSTNTLGGVDGLKFEFTYMDTTNNRLVKCPILMSDTNANCLPMSGSQTEYNPGNLPLTQLKSITVWMLLRSDRNDQNYTNANAYILGSTASKITLGPFNDNYRRLLLYKTVEVKNLASIY